MSASLLVELLTEELPPKALHGLARAFAGAIFKGVVKADLAKSDCEPRVFATPRRIAVLIPDVRAVAPGRSQAKKLMPSSVAFDAQGDATPALRKRLSKEQASLETVSRVSENGVDYAFLKREIPGVSLRDGLQAALTDAAANLPIPKLMSYQLADGATTVYFVRPAHRLVALHGDAVVEVEVLGLRAGRITAGHRFQGATTITLAASDEYEQRLADEGGVIADFDQRRLKIYSQLESLAAKSSANLGAASEYDSVLDEVAGLVEMPTVYLGSFEPGFLEVPQECLILTMRQNQRYFPLFDGKQSLTPHFLMVSNMNLAEPRDIVEGNERVVRPRLADARFFYEIDRKVRLFDRVAKLAAVIYHNQLGTQLERTERLRRLAVKIHAMSPDSGTNGGDVERAALLAKADLVTEMVGEFPQLQGIMGRYYALNDGEPRAVADAIAEQYLPRFAGDILPSTGAGICVALAEKLDTLVAIWAVGQQPTGEKDPHGLRRAALGVLRILAEASPAALLDLRVLLEEAAAGLPKEKLKAGVVAEIYSFMLERLHAPLRERGYDQNEIDAVLADEPTDIAGIWKRIAAVRSFRAMPEALALAAANKRIRNILRKSGRAEEIIEALLVEAEEQRLYSAMTSLAPRVANHVATRDYAAALVELAQIRSEVDLFFDKVLVNVDDEALRRNRLALLTRLESLMNQVADISKLAV